MYNTDMKVFKTAMKLLVDAQISLPVDFRINKNASEFIVSGNTWRLVVPVDCETDVEDLLVKMTNEEFQKLYKSLRSVKKEMTIDVDEDNTKLLFNIKDDKIVEVLPTEITKKVSRPVENETLAEFKIDDMLSFLNNAFASRSNVFTPMDAIIELRYEEDALRFMHFTPVKMSCFVLQNNLKHQSKTVIIPSKELNIVYALFKNSFEFDGELQENDAVLIFKTKRFKIGIKKELRETKAVGHLFDSEECYLTPVNDAILNQLYAIKKSLSPMNTITVDKDAFPLASEKTKPTKDDLMLRLQKEGKELTLEPYLNQSCLEIARVSKVQQYFYDFARTFDITQSFIEPGFTLSVLANQMLRFKNPSSSVMVYLLPIIPVNRGLVAELED